MEFMVPTKIDITSSDEVVELVSNTKKGYLYKYIKSFTKLGWTIEWDEKYIVQQLSNYFKDTSDMKFIQEEEKEDPKQGSLF